MTSSEESSTGLTPRVAAVLAYLAGPFSGLLVLMAERTSTYVRFHAWQSVIGLGGFGLLVALLLVVSFASVIVSATAFYALLTMTWVVWAAWIVLWGICVVKAFGGRRWKLPIAGAYAERFSQSPSA
jgi:uncharacterized membrane protein